VPGLINERCEQDRYHSALFFLPADSPPVRRDFMQAESIYPMIKKLLAVHLTAIHFIPPEMSVLDRPAQLLSVLLALSAESQEL
jgi:hypothetical protein